ncbi:MAG: ABC transporter ATP-binding protein, partial [Methylobacteriaceae bacterium]|nr:ABC transporter ATP-binding protein [Methylobacteriaceae bacterium]
GKSTAALSLLGMVRPPGRLVGGRVMFEGRDLFGLAAEEARRIRGRDIGLIVQNPRMALSPLHTVGEQIVNVYRAHNRATAEEARRHAIAMLKLVGINDPGRRVHAYPHEISGGMAQRVLIAIALSSKPKLLVADEPTSGLDVTIQAQFLDAMWTATRETGSAVLLVTQDLGVIANYCDRVVVMHEGAVVEEKSARDFFRAPEHPYSRAIVALQSERRPVAPASAARAEEPVLEVRGLVKRFPIRGSTKTVHAVDDVSLSIGPGETLGLVGESGSGKTTVGRCLLRLIEPEAGEILFRGQPIQSLSPAALRPYRSKLQIVFQDPQDQLNPRWRVRDVLAEPLDLHGALARPERDARIAELLDLVGVPIALSEARPRALSAGLQQRLSIARALATDPALIVLDEPTSALAPAARAGVVRLLRDLQARLGLSYLFISHDLNTVRYLCHRIAVMYLGQVVEIGTSQEVFARPRHPYTRALLAAHLTPDPTRRRVDRVATERLEGEIPSPIDLPTGCYLAGRCPAERGPRCRDERQRLLADAGGRLARCWRATGGELDAAAPHDFALIGEEA